MRAKLLKFADKISNLRSVAASAPVDWDKQRCIDYVTRTKKVVAALAVKSPLLEQQFDRAAKDAERSIVTRAFFVE